MTILEYYLALIKEKGMWKMVATELKDEEAGKVTFLFCLNLKFDDVPTIPPNVTCS